VIKGNRGQLSIFLGITLILVMGMLAFIINIGLFVKAKINLQNSVDAAAFAGASVQARQLTNIAYLNWEMRNNYKEWLFKYYILGQLSSIKTGQTSRAGTSLAYPLAISLTGNKLNTDFTLKTLERTAVGGLNIGNLGCRGPNGEELSNSNEPSYDHFNLPTICIHNGSADDICPTYTVPGLPSFPAIAIAGISDISQTAVAAFSDTKATNCSNRSRDNFNTALIWAFGEGETPTNPISPSIPAIYAANRPGAWPRALELAMRMRNLEMIVNLPPHNGAITHDVARNYPMMPGAEFSLYERPLKAFMSAFRNLGGGRYKGNGPNGGKDELSREFKLYELAPKPFDAPDNSLSGFLIPKTSTALKKHYLDLQAMPLNLASMFSSFTITNSQIDPNTQSSATCGVSKTAMPVPGFILGFVKNPEVMTYYAVKGESKFIGLFSPFKGTPHESGVTLTAYAAAKPFGGRIGPKLFSFKDNSKVQVREADPSHRGLANIYGLDISPAIASRGFCAGDPIPVSSGFWVNGRDVLPTLGGVPTSTADQIYFGIPNIIYDYVGIDRQSNATGLGGRVIDIKPKRYKGDAVGETLGLFDPAQFNLLKSSLNPGIINGSLPSYNSTHILDGIAKARRATGYDVANYLVPDYKHDSSSVKQNALPYITEDNQIPPPTGTHDFIMYKIFAPLVGSSLLYGSAGDVGRVVEDYIASMSGAVDIYEKAIHDVAKKIYNTPDTIGAIGGQNNTANAAKTIHINAGNSTYIPPLPVTGNCPIDIASKFHYFFQPTKEVEICKIKPLKLMMKEYIAIQAAGDKKMNFITEYYTGDVSKGGLDQDSLYTAYYPGTRQGVSPTGLIGPPLGTPGENHNSKRNYYSTKFFRMAMVVESSADLFTESTLREALDRSPDDTDFPRNPSNLIRNDASSELGGPFFLDF
jgi:hypothetical protein